MSLFKTIIERAKALSVSELDRIEASEFPAVCTTWGGKEITIIAKRLSMVEIKSCGDFSLINLAGENYGDSGKDPLVEAAKFAELQHNVLKLALIDPTYEQIEERIFKKLDIEEFKERMEKIKEEFLFNKSANIKELEKEFAMLEFRTKFFMPQDFLIDMFIFATSQDISDIKLLESEEILYDAAIIAKKGRCRISDILCEDGVWTPFNKDDIDIRGEIIYQERTKKA